MPAILFLFQIILNLLSLKFIRISFTWNDYYSNKIDEFIENQKYLSNSDTINP